MRSPRMLPLALSFTLGAALAAGPALAARPQAEAADQTLGMALMSVAFAADGTVLSGSAVTYANRVTTGQFDVTFSRSVSDCQAVASVGLPQDVIAPVGYAIPRQAYPDGFRVRTYDTGGSSADRPFQLIVFCPK